MIAENVKRLEGLRNGLADVKERLQSYIDFYSNPDKDGKERMASCRRQIKWYNQAIKEILSNP